MKRQILFCIFVFLCARLSAQQTVTSEDQYLSWTAEQAKQIGKAMTANGRVGGFWDTRVKHTERSYNYKLRATWLTPDVIRAAARLQQIKLRLSVDETRSIVEEAEAAGDTVVKVEIDPREGSGVIPLQWQSWLQPKGTRDAAQSVSGESISRLRNLKGLAGVTERDYDYDVFWIVFPLQKEDGTLLFSESNLQAELVVRIRDKEGRVEWTIPSSIRNRMRKLKEAESPTVDSIEE